MAWPELMRASFFFYILSFPSWLGLCMAMHYLLPVILSFLLLYSSSSNYTCTYCICSLNSLDSFYQFKSLYWDCIWNNHQVPSNIKRLFLLASPVDLTRWGNPFIDRSSDVWHIEHTGFILRTVNIKHTQFKSKYFSLSFIQMVHTICNVHVMRCE